MTFLSLLSIRSIVVSDFLGNKAIFNYLGYVFSLSKITSLLLLKQLKLLSWYITHVLLWTTTVSHKPLLSCVVLVKHCIFVPTFEYRMSSQRIVLLRIISDHWTLSTWLLQYLLIDVHTCIVELRVVGTFSHVKLRWWGMILSSGVRLFSVHVFIGCCWRMARLSATYYGHLEGASLVLILVWLKIGRLNRGSLLGILMPNFVMTRVS